MKYIENQRFGEERALYNSDGIALRGCRFEGEEDGESALKESQGVILEDCFMDLRYPLWHNQKLRMVRTTMTPNCRAALWYDDEAEITDSNLLGIKALRECGNIQIKDCRIVSPEFGWRCRNVSVADTEINGEYVFFESENLCIENMTFQGKYSFQYVKTMEIKKSVLKTKDAFWHSHNVIVYDSTLEGEYLAWYSENLTLVRCHIKGTQPFCYCKNLKLVDCTMEDTDLSFENSSVEAKIIGNIVSIKNPRSGHITADSCDCVIIEDSKYPVEAVIDIKNKG